MTFVEPVGTPLGIQFMEYESKLGPQHYQLINGLSDTARQTHPELMTGMIATKVNGQPTARMPSTEKVREMLAVRPVTVTFTDRMADAETAMTLGVVNARVKWKALVDRNRSRWSKGFVLARGEEKPLAHDFCRSGLRFHTDGGVQGTTRRESVWRWSQSRRWSETGG